ncbi:transporter, MotA/TolQ/ExbB proton channel family, putative [Verrucomicrobiia bacterium DG1235]|nr:transporter, MotA/TolQ/ExbB proton channel family, putative [Verrucomicrobiae bacterium DG1235]
MLLEYFVELRDFFDKGGSVLFAIFAVLTLMWILILERLFFFLFRMKDLHDSTLRDWEARQDKSSWKAHKVRDAMVVTMRLLATKRIGLIRTLVAICPLLGILGTVAGMIFVFDVITITGTGNARGMAAGITKATLPTMAGLVASLSGLLCAVRLERAAQRAEEKLVDELQIDTP